MTDTISAISRSLSADVQSLGAVSQNVANAATPGFRAVRVTPDFAGRLDVANSFDLTDGTLMQTGRTLDLALRGKGFFAVERDGKTVMTRAGNFRRDADGYLVTVAGDRVLGESGPIVLDGLDVRIDGKGEMWAGKRSIGKLSIVDIADPRGLRSLGNGAYAYDGIFSQWQGSVIQGSIERANVDAADETIHLMELTRHAESVQRAISIYDKTMDTGINRLGEN